MSLARAGIRRRALVAALPAIACARGASAAPPSLPAPASLADELTRALARGRVLVVMASLEGCPYCRLVRESYLRPWLAEGQPVVQLEMGRRLPVSDFAGAPSTHADLVRAWGVRVAPTVLFFGRDAREAAPRLAGVPLPDFYGAYLDERLRSANRSLG